MTDSITILDYLHSCLISFFINSRSRRESKHNHNKEFETVTEDGDEPFFLFGILDV